MVQDIIEVIVEEDSKALVTSVTEQDIKPLNVQIDHQEKGQEISMECA